MRSQKGREEPETWKGNRGQEKMAQLENGGNRSGENLFMIIIIIALVIADKRLPNKTKEHLCEVPT